MRIKSIVVGLVALALGITACSGGRSMLPGTASAPVNGEPTSGVWRLIHSHSGQPQSFSGANIGFLLTDGTVLAQTSGTGWSRYTPDANGDYSKGTWKQAASLPSGYSPDAGASNVLADGRLVMSGGEYNFGSFALTNLGAVYDPVADTWTPLGHPKGWGWIGDSPSSMLPDGRMLLGQKITKRDALLDPKTLQWKDLPNHHNGKADFNAEEGWTLLPDGTILTVDVKNDPNSEIYDPSTNQWKTAGKTPVVLASHWTSGGCISYGPKKRDCYYPPGEIGPAVLRPDGTVFATGSGQNGSGYGLGHTAIYHSSGSLAGKWTAGPDFPNDDNAGDSYALLEPNGKVLVFGNTGRTYEWDGKTFAQSSLNWSGPPLLLPTGQVMMLGRTVALYTPTGSPQASWAPKIKSVPSSVSAGQTYKVTGTQFNGLSQVMAFGDEYQNATNYPLVRITNDESGHVFYARTHDHSSMGVATGSKLVWTYFDVPTGIDTGASHLVVVANGIPSKAIAVTVGSSRRIKPR
ncbi:MAG TPA: hypothetical protein VHR97_07365 [Candidatus Baltobacteraceae bacterium]|nr:hypothetical protein [Candidatus Baltobacteraceae bacterium]